MSYRGALVKLSVARESLFVEMNVDPADVLPVGLAFAHGKAVSARA